jgi:hypothetical protein
MTALVAADIKYVFNVLCFLNVYGHGYRLNENKKIGVSVYSKLPSGLFVPPQIAIITFRPISYYIVMFAL